MKPTIVDIIGMEWENGDNIYNDMWHGHPSDHEWDS
jgi:hypothetical protein